MNNDAFHVICADISRLCIRATGADAARYLHSQLSNGIESLQVGHSCSSFVLEPTGKVIALVRVTRIGDDDFLLDTDAVPELEEIVLARLNKFKIRVDVAFTAEVANVVAIRSSNGEPLPSSVRDAGTSEQSFVVDAMWADGRALDVFPIGGASDSDGSTVDAQKVSDLIGESTVSADPHGDVERVRVRSGWPSMGREILPGETLPAATGIVDHCVSFTKGCYPGQELVERMDARGSTAPRSLRRLRCSDVSPSNPESVSVGDVVTVDGRDVGTVTSVAGDWALAYVQRGVELGEPVSPAG